MDHACFGDDRVWPRRIAQALLWATLLLAAAALLGRLNGIPLLASYRVEYIQMAPMTSICFIALAAALLIAQRAGAGRITAVCAGFVAVLVAACGLVVWLGSLGTASDNLTAGWIAMTAVMGLYGLALMSPATGALFALAGMALAALLFARVRGASARRWLFLAAALGLLTAAIAMCVGISYGIDAPLFYDGAMVPMALPTAIGFVLLGCGLVAMALICVVRPERWTGRLADLSVATQLRVGLTGIVLAVLVFGHVVDLQKDSLWEQTDTLYQHPLAVIRLAGDLRADALRIRSTLRDLTRAKDISDAVNLAQNLGADRAAAKEEMASLASNYLGPPADIAALSKELNYLLAISESLTRPPTGVPKDLAASARLADDGATATLRIVDRIEVIKDFAMGDAQRLYVEAERRNRALETTVIASFVLVLLVSTLVGWQVSRQILDPVKELTSVAAHFGADNLDVRSRSASANEIGALAATFNSMADTIQAGAQSTALLTEQLRRSEASLAAQNKELETFSYSVSHDLRAPLRSIDGFSRILLEDYGTTLDADGRNSLDRIRAASQRMAQLIDDLLRLSRLSRGKLHYELVDLSAMAREIEAELSSEDPVRRVTLAVAAGVTANGDRQLLRIALTNLLDNAWKFTTKRVDARIEFGMQDRDGRRVYFVRDNGVGFDPAYADKLFGAFQRLHSSSEYPGTGIGLATVLRVIRRHGGKVQAEGAVDQGATFSFELGAEATPT
jgi:signal transduction histidine kinase